MSILNKPIINEPTVFPMDNLFKACIYNNRPTYSMADYKKMLDDFENDKVKTEYIEKGD